MLEIIRDNDKNIIACCEWYLVDINGKMDDKGNYVWINEVEINPSQRGNGLLKKFIKIITDKAPQSEYGYFQRRKYKDRVRMYSRKKWLKLTED